MSKPLWLAALVLAAGTGCTGSTVPPPSSPPGAVPGAASTPASASPSPGVLPTIELEGDLAERPARWEHVAFIPFGDRRKQLGFHHFRESVDSLPSSFAVDQDGSLWILDRWKDRLAHYSAQGTFLDAIGLDPVPRATDLVVVGGDRWVIESEPRGLLDRIDGSGRSSRVAVRMDGRGVDTYELYSTTMGLVAYAAGFSDAIAAGRHEGPFGFVRVDPVTGSARDLPGLPAGPGRFVLATGQDSAGQDSRVTYITAGASIVQPIRIRLRTGPEPGGRSLPTVAGIASVLATTRDLVALVRLAPDRSVDAARYGGGRWLLRIGESPLVWERLPEPSTPDELQHRHLAAGPDGSIYLMVAQEDGESILRRP